MFVAILLFCGGRQPCLCGLHVTQADCWLRFNMASERYKNRWGICDRLRQALERACVGMQTTYRSGAGRELLCGTIDGCFLQWTALITMNGGDYYNKRLIFYNKRRFFTMDGAYYNKRLVFFTINGYFYNERRFFYNKRRFLQWTAAIITINGCFFYNGRRLLQWTAAIITIKGWFFYNKRRFFYNGRRLLQWTAAIITING